MAHASNGDLAEQRDVRTQSWPRAGGMVALCALLSLLLLVAGCGNSARTPAAAVGSSGAATPAFAATGEPATPTLTRTLSATPVPTATATPTKTPRPAASAPPTRIRIPSIQVDADIIEVDYEAQLEEGNKVTLWKVADFAVGFHSGTAYPGRAGNTVLAGHNNIRGRVFRHLLDLHPGADIYLYVDEQEFRYVVSQVLLVKEKGMTEGIRHDNAGWIQPTADERLTLVSCWPFIKPDHRVFVVAFPPQD